MEVCARPVRASGGLSRGSDFNMKGAKPGKERLK